MKVVGIDLSSHAIDIVKIDQHAYQGITWLHVDLGKKGDAFERTRLVAELMSYCDGVVCEFRDDVIAIGIEEPFGKGHLSTAAGYRVQGAVLACLPPSTLVYPWAPATWKKQIGIGGNADKAKIMGWAIAKENAQRRSWGYPQDVADALGIAEATRMRLSPP